MAKNQFKWLAQSCETRRFDNGSAVLLVQGETYDADVVPAYILDEWVKTGAASRIGNAAKDKEK